MADSGGTSTRLGIVVGMAHNGIPVIDVDGHVFEQDDIWEQFLPKELHARRPRLVVDGRGTTRYRLNGSEVDIPPGTGLGAWAPEGIRESAGQREGAWDPKARLTDMDVDGIDVAVLYGAASLGFYRADPVEYSIAICRAYNEWLAWYCSADPTRLKGTPALPLRDTTAALAEAKRVVEDHGFVSLTVPCQMMDRNPDHADNDSFYTLACDLDVPLGFHAGGGSFNFHRFTDDYATLHALEFPMNLMFALSTLTSGGVFDRFPSLRVALLEGGIGWVPYLVHRLDEHFHKRKGEMKCRYEPSEYLRRGNIVVTCEPDEPEIAYAATVLPEGVIAYASDYPHWDCEFPGSVAEIGDRDDLTMAQRRAILGGNAQRLFGSRVSV